MGPLNRRNCAVATDPVVRCYQALESAISPEFVDSIFSSNPSIIEFDIVGTSSCSRSRFNRFLDSETPHALQTSPISVFLVLPTALYSTVAFCWFTPNRCYRTCSISSNNLFPLMNTCSVSGSSAVICYISATASLPSEYSKLDLKRH